MSSPSTQQFVPIQEIRDGVVVLKSGELRSVVMCQAINLDLKSQDEQTAILLQFQSFLNSLEFSSQIIVSSRRLDIRPYVIKLEKRLEEIEGDLLRIQTREYINFIQKFNETYDVMSKYFYIVIPYGASMSLGSTTGLLGGLFGKKKEGPTLTEAEAFEEKRTQLEQRVSVITGGLESMGIECKMLDTPALIELYQKTFNPGELHSSAGAMGQ
jgi:type IV secretory pathway VirB4 component